MIQKVSAVANIPELTMSTEVNSSPSPDFDSEMYVVKRGIEAFSTFFAICK